MSMSLKQEHALLSPDEIALLRSTHHPEIYDLKREDLVALQGRLRDLRSKARSLLRQKQRESRGKSEARGSSFPGSSDPPQKRKQAFAAALKRVNKELSRLKNLDAKARHIGAARKALAQLRASQFAATFPASRTEGAGMQPLESTRRRRILPRSKIGRVLQRNRIAQAVRDARPQ
jgi:hypothetical protein